MVLLAAVFLNTLHNEAGRAVDTVNFIIAEIFADFNRKNRSVCFPVYIFVRLRRTYSAESASAEEGRIRAQAYHDKVVPAMEALRAPADRLEMIVDKELWPFPSYGDLIFEV